MCGILGAVSLDDSSPPIRQVARFLPLLHHRGPDQQGTARLGPACFGHTRLSILGVDQDTARQPVKQHSCLLSFNGEIYNFHELVAELRSAGLRCGGTSDTETLFLCLSHWGVERTLDRLDGMFAFAFYDDRTRTLYLARDPMGEKPLYWSRTPHRVWFASEIKVLLATGEASSAPNLSRIDDYFFNSKVNGAATMFRDVVELEPGTLLIHRLDMTEPRIAAYWRIENVADGSDQDYDQAMQNSFAENITHAAASRRISDVPVGILLSGGIDSNSLTELMLAATPNDSLDLLFADNQNKQVSERPDAELFLEDLRRRHPKADLRFRPNVLNFDDYFDRLRKLTWHFDEPVQFHNSSLLGGLCAIARENGLKVLLSGEGSDELLYGYVRFSRTREEIEGETNRQNILAHLYYGGGMHAVEIIQRLTRGVAEGAEATEPWQWLIRHFDDWSFDTLQMVFSQKFRLQTLLQRQDRVGMSEGIEIRVPFLAPWLVRWINGLPMEAKFDTATGETKRILRAVMRDRLPERILTKPKDGFPSDMTVWLRDQRVRDMATDMIGDPRGFCQTYLDAPLAKHIVADHFSGAVRRDLLVWLLLALEIWHQVFSAGVTVANAVDPGLYEPNAV